MTNDPDLSTSILDLIECKDGSFAILAATNDVLNPSLYQHYIVRLDQSGNILSNAAYFEPVKIGKSLIFTGGSFLAELANGDLAALLLLDGGVNNLTRYSLILARIRADNSLVWSKSYSSVNLLTPIGILPFQGGMIIPIYVWSGCQIGSYSLNLVNVDEATGNIQQSKGFCYSTPNNISGGYSQTRGNAVRLDNGNYKVVYNHQHEKALYYVFDSTLNMLDSKEITWPDPNNFLHSLYVNQVGNVYGSSLSGFNKDALDNYYAVIDSNNNIIQNRHVNFSLSEKPDLFDRSSMNIGKDNNLKFYVSVKTGSQTDLQVLRTNIYNNDTSCIGPEKTGITIKSLSLMPNNWQLVNGIPNVLSSFATTVNNNNVGLSRLLLCQSIKTTKLNLGNDTVLCLNDTLKLKANSGFANYHWDAPFLYRNINDSIISVLPRSDSTYVVSVVSRTGCQISDSVFISLKLAPSISLGEDTSFCQGTNLILDAGSGFLNYKWSTEANGQQINIKDPGIYSVTALHANGCNSSDTFIVRSVYVLPDPELKSNGILCTNQNDIVRAKKGFVSYLWSDGSALDELKVTNEGVYWVQVSDINGCTNTDTINVSKLAMLPAGFAPRDTSMCTYETIKLETQFGYNKYTWSTGSSLPYITISLPGEYWLEVTDSNGCVKREYIKVKPKACINNIAFPNAFTPGKTGSNDIFKPIVKGNLQMYRFSVYNRWGQRVFSTSEPDKGWNGRIGSSSVATGTFVWVCEYQFRGESKFVQKGTVILIR